eukprot:SM000006S19400  [mRNA]  locus=s6:538397:539319:+ [translate_table: standard]
MGLLVHWFRHGTLTDKSGKVTYTGSGSAPNFVTQMGFKYSHTFTTAGSFSYNCFIHQDAMAGTITVQGQGAASPPPSAGKVPPPAIKKTPPPAVKKSPPPAVKKSPPPANNGYSYPPPPEDDDEHYPPPSHKKGHHSTGGHHSKAKGHHPPGSGGHH